MNTKFIWKKCMCERRKIYKNIIKYTVIMNLLWSDYTVVYTSDCHASSNNNTFLSHTSILKLGPWIPSSSSILAQWNISYLCSLSTLILRLILLKKLNKAIFLITTDFFFLLVYRLFILPIWLESQISLWT